MSDTVIRVESLSKMYRIRHKGGSSKDTPQRFSDVLSNAFTAPFKRLMGRDKGDSNTSNVEDFWALRDVSFEVKRGEVVGIIGRNGAGKSTLLKILSRITEPTKGRVTIHGRVASLLEVGTGFHPDLTGRENIYLNGAILGMSRAEVRRKFDEIVAFAEVEKFLDTPVKRYSSGMYVRLAFAVAAHLEPEILIVDEVLAVGDAEFQKKCLGKMKDVATGEGRTVLFVSHNMAAVRNLCNKAILLAAGQIRFLGEVSAAVDAYSQQGLTAAGTQWLRPKTLAFPALRFEAISISIKGKQPHLILECKIALRSISTTPEAFIAVDIFDSSMTPIMQALPSAKPFIADVSGGCELLLEIELPALIPGQYHADFWIGPHFSSTTDYVRNAVAFEINDSPTGERNHPHSRDHGFLVPPSNCHILNKG